MPRHVVHLIKRVSQKSPLLLVCLRSIVVSIRDTVVSDIVAVITAITVTMHLYVGDLARVSLRYRLSNNVKTS